MLKTPLISQRYLHRASPEQVSCRRGWGHVGGVGPLMGGPQCRMSNLRNGNVPCRYFYNIHVDFKIVYCRMSNLRNGYVTNIISHVDRLHVACRF